jgi:hypothetical protein
VVVDQISYLARGTQNENGMDAFVGTAREAPDRLCFVAIVVFKKSIVVSVSMAEEDCCISVECAVGYMVSKIRVVGEDVL